MTTTESMPAIHRLETGLDLAFFPSETMERWSENFEKEFLRISYAARVNILSAIKSAESGHIGTSFSSIDVILVVRKLLDGWKQKEFHLDTIFFSSKGHDAPAIYAAMHADGELQDNDLFRLRRLDGLPGHPEINTPGVPTNTG